MADTLEAWLRQAQTEDWPVIDGIGALVQDELVRLHDRLIQRRIKRATFRDPGRPLDNHLAQAIGMAAIHKGHKVMYREAHILIEHLAEATLEGLRKLPPTAAEDLIEVIMRRYERGSTLLTSNRPLDDWGNLLDDAAAVTAKLDRILHRAHLRKTGPRSYSLALVRICDSCASRVG